MVYIKNYLYIIVISILLISGCHNDNNNNNQAPIADAGMDQTHVVGQTVQLDGSGSYDPDGDTLYFDWQLIESPQGSAATLNDNTLIRPEFTVDLAGTYKFTLIVNDGELFSNADEVISSSINAEPIANAGADQSVNLGDLVTLDGSASIDNDGDPLTYLWTLTPPNGSSALLDNNALVQPQFVVDILGSYTATLVVNDGFVDSQPDSVIITTDNAKPTAVITPTGPIDVEVGQSIDLDAQSSFDPEGSTLTYNWALTSQPSTSSSVLANTNQVITSLTPDVVGDYLIQLTVNDGQLTSDAITALVTGTSSSVPGNTTPIAMISSDTGSVTSTTTVTMDASNSSDADGDSLTYQWTLSAPNGSNASLSATNTETVTFTTDVIGEYSVSLIVNDGFVDSQATSQIISQISLPNGVATTSVSGSSDIKTFSDSISFLYTATNPNQVGADVNAFDEERVGVVQGQVKDADGSPVAGVSISVKNQSDLGITETRVDGIFDLAVNGNETIILEYNHPDYLPVQRIVHPLTHNFINVPEVTLTKLDNKATVVTLGINQSQIHQASEVTGRGATRQAVLFIPPNTNAKLQFADGSEQAVNTLTIHATEYTVDFDPSVMPAPLPFNTAYTYCVELSADEITAMGAKTVTFDQPISFYVDNFLQFKAGTTIPAGYYDFDLADWLPEKNAKAIDILAENNGQAVLDVTGNGVAATTEELVALAIDSTELEQLASLYEPGDSLWRAQLDHFSPHDYNTPYGPSIPAANTPNQSNNIATNNSVSDSNQCGKKGCIIQAQNQKMIELLPIKGTSLEWVYSSKRAQIVEVPIRVTDDSPGVENIEGIEVTLNIAGKTFYTNFGRSPYDMVTLGANNQKGQVAPNITNYFFWDGLDGYGNRVEGKFYASVTLDSWYPIVYQESASDLEESWDQYGSDTVTLVEGSGAGIGDPNAPMVIVSNTQAIPITSPASPGQEWTLNIHHHYDVEDQILLRGDGNIDYVDSRFANSAFINTEEIDTTSNVICDSTPRPLKEIQGSSMGHAIAANSDIYFVNSTTFDDAICKLAADTQLVTRIAGFGADFTNDNISALDAYIIVGDTYYENAFKVGPDNAIYFVQPEITNILGNRIRKVIDGKITTIVGTLDSSAVSLVDVKAGIKVKADEIFISFISGALEQVAYFFFGPDNTLYFVSLYNGSIFELFRVEADGFVTFIDYRPTFRAQGINLKKDIPRFMDNQGNLYISGYDDLTQDSTSSDSIYRLSPGGEVTLVIESLSSFNEDSYYAGEFIPATEAEIVPTEPYLVDKEGRFYFWDSVREYGFHNSAMMVIDQQGFISPLLGKTIPVAENASVNSNEIYLNEATLDVTPTSAAEGISIAPDGTIIGNKMDSSGGFILWRIGPTRTVVPPTTLTGISSSDDIAIADAEQNEFYIFNAQGRHLATLDLLTKAVIYTFEYDTEGKLIKVIDNIGSITSFEYNTLGQVIRIIAPNNQVTTASYNADGRLNQWTTPGGAVYQIEIINKGLLTSFQPPDTTNPFIYTYNTSNGRLAQDYNPVGGGLSLSRAESFENFSYSVTTQTAEGYNQRFSIENVPGTGTIQTITDSIGLATKTLFGADGSSSVTLADGTVIEIKSDADPTWGELAPVETFTLTLPSGLVYTQTETREVTVDSILGFEATRSHKITVEGSTRINHYDTATHTLTETSPLGRKLVTVFDEQGRVLSTTHGNKFPFEHSYNSTGKLASVTQGSGSDMQVYSFEYDANNVISAIIDTLGNRMEVTLDADDHLTAFSYPNGDQVTLDYNKRGEIVKLNIPTGASYEFVYDDLGRQVGKIAPEISGNKAQWTYSYNLDDKLTLVDMPGPDSMAMDYDSAGRLQKVGLNRGDITLQYNTTTGNLAQIISPDNISLDFSYDGLLLTQLYWTGDTSGSIDLVYNNRLNIVEHIINGAESISYSYDEDNLLIGVDALTITRDTLSPDIKAITLDNSTITQTFDGFDKLDSITAVVDGQNLFSQTIEHNTLGQISHIEETIAGTTTSYDYTYDSRDRLIAADRDGNPWQSYDYDANSNRISIQDQGNTETASFDLRDQLLSQGNTSFSYSQDGRLESKTQGSDTTQYNFDMLGNLTQVTLADGRVITYLYDGRGRRVSKAIDGNKTVGYLYKDQIHPLVQLDANNNVIARFFYDGTDNAPRAMERGGKYYLLITDQLGSVRLVVDASDGSIAQALDYDPWGKVLQDTNPGFQPFGFAGGLYDTDTGLVLFGTRDYDASTGRWTIPDLIGFSSGETNLYLYVGANPINFTDPEGKIFPALIAIKVAIAIADTAMNLVIEYLRGGDVLDYAATLVSGIVAGLLPLPPKVTREASKYLIRLLFSTVFEKAYSTARDIAGAVANFTSKAVKYLSCVVKSNR